MDGNLRRRESKTNKSFPVGKVGMAGCPDQPVITVEDIKEGEGSPHFHDHGGGFEIDIRVPMSPMNLEGQIEKVIDEADEEQRIKNREAEPEPVDETPATEEALYEAAVVLMSGRMGVRAGKFFDSGVQGRSRGR